MVLTASVRLQSYAANVRATLRRTNFADQAPVKRNRAAQKRWGQIGILQVEVKSFRIVQAIRAVCDWTLQINPHLC